MNEPKKPQDIHEVYAERLFAHGYATEGARVRALKHYKPKPGELPPLTKALLPESTAAEQVAIDIASRVGQLVEGMTTQKDGTVALATAIMALALVHRRFEMMASEAKLDDGAAVPFMEVDVWNVKGIAVCERLATLTKIVLGEDSKPGSIIA